MPYIHFPWTYCEDLSQDCVICKEAFWHLTHVLRIPDRSEIVAFDGRNCLRLGRLCCDKKTGKIEFVEPIFKVPIPKKSFNLVQCLPNNIATFEDILRKTCELGIRNIYPVLGERTEKASWRTEIWNKRQERFNRILQESCKQAKNPFLPQLHAVVPLEYLPKLSVGHCYFGNLEMTQSGIPVLKDEDNISCIVGPEGGFSPQEVVFLKTFATPIQLPTCVLRVETAVVGLLSVLKMNCCF